jgi:NTP pyrophosphatase (non-canonical NTP hydrolase)
MSKFEITENQVAVLAKIQETIHKSCIAAGWYEDLKTGEPIKRNMGEVLMLMVTELSEAMEGHRKNLNDDHLPARPMVEVELADCIIRILDTAGAEGLDVAGAIREKFAYNQTRSDHKRENRLKPFGKKV